jgi:hypothetical protein
MVRAWFRLSVAVGCVVGIGGITRAQLVELFQASDLPRLAKEGVTVSEAGAGPLEIRVWDRGDRSWSSHTDAEGIELVPASREDGVTESKPRWHAAGTLESKAGQAIRLRIAGAIFDPAKVTGDFRKGESNTTQPKWVVVPTAIALVKPNENVPLDRALGSIRGRLDTTAAIPDTRRERVRTNHEGVNFQAPATAESWRQRARELREQLLVTTGLWPAPERGALAPRVFGKMERDGYTIEKVAIETLPGFYLTGNLYKPTKFDGKRPAILCPHGHWADGRMNPEVQARCIHWARLGCVVFSYDMAGYNDTKEFEHKFLNERLARWGFSLVTLQTWNSLRAVDWISALPEVDGARIGCTGESGGGTQTFLLAALDERVRVLAPVVMVSDNFQGGCSCENAAGMRHGLDNVAIAALAAPREQYFVGATGDWTLNTLSRVLPSVRGVYELLGASSRVDAALFDFDHNYNATSRNAVYRFMAPRLLDTKDLPASTDEPAPKAETPETLQVWSDAEPAPSDRKSAKELEDTLVASLSLSLRDLAPGGSAASWQAARSFLAVSHAVRLGARSWRLEKLTATLREPSERSGDHVASVTHGIIERTGSGEVIPIVRLAPRAPAEQVTIVAHGRGKAGIFSANGDPIPLVARLLEAGHEVIGFDPLYVGESFDPEHPATVRPSTDHSLCYNPSLVAEQAHDLATVGAWANQTRSGGFVHLVGLEGAGPLVLLARPCLSGIGRTAVDLAGFDYGDGSDELPAALDLPGVLQFGGLPTATALAAPGPLWLLRPGDKFARAWAERAYELAGGRTLLHITGGPPDAERLARWLDLGD